MSSYTPEFYYGAIPGTYDEYGLVPWPKHMQPRSTEMLPDIDLPALFNEATAQANMPGVVVLSLNPKDRVELATTIERLINLLDAIDGDCDLEASADDEPSLGWTTSGSGMSVSTYKLDLDLERDDSDKEDTLGWGQGSQAFLHVDQYDEAEEENEHGGDVQDEPHDRLDEGNDEPFLGRLETIHQGPGTYSYGADDLRPHALAFDGSGYINARNALRKVNGQPPLGSASLQPVAEHATRLSDGTVFRFFAVTQDFTPNRMRRQRRDPDQAQIIRPGVARIGL